MNDIYNKKDKADKVQALKARLAHLGDEYVRLQNECKSVTLEMDNISKEIEFEVRGG